MAGEVVTKMAVITIPSSFSPIAAAIDVFTQDRLAQQKRARQAEQDAWNREARARQRQNWGYIDQEREYQQQQREKAAQAQAEQDAKALAAEALTQGHKAQYTDRDFTTTYTGIRPETGYGTGLDELAGAGEDERVATPSEHQGSIARTLAMYPGAPKPGVAAYNAVLGGEKEPLDPQAVWTAIQGLKSPDGVVRTQAQIYLKELKFTATEINNMAGPEAARAFLDMDKLKLLHDQAEGTAMSVGQGGVLPAGATGIDEYSEEVGTIPRTALYSAEDRGRALSEAKDMLRGRTGESYSDYQKLWAQPKVDEPTPLMLSAIGEGLTRPGVKASYGRVFDSSGDDELSKIASALQAGLQQYGGPGNVALGDLPTDIGSISDVNPQIKDMIMRNIWQAAQILHHQNPSTSARAIFENLTENIGYGDRGLDIIGINKSMITPGRDDTWSFDEPAAYKAGIGQEGGPTLKSPQEIAADYQALLEFSQRHQ